MEPKAPNNCTTVFRPDRVVLVIRDRDANLASLDGKIWRDADGMMEEKFRKLDTYLSRPWLFHEIVRYEEEFPEFMTHPLVRSKHDIVFFNALVSPWCRKNYLILWGLGASRVAPGSEV